MSNLNQFLITGKVVAEGKLTRDRGPHEFMVEVLGEPYGDKPAPTQLIKITCWADGLRQTSERLNIGQFVVVSGTISGRETETNRGHFHNQSLNARQIVFANGEATDETPADDLSGVPF